MEWLTGLALLPALACTLMMGGMVLAGALGLRRGRGSRSPEAPAPDAEHREEVTR